MRGRGYHLHYGRRGGRGSLPRHSADDMGRVEEIAYLSGVEVYSAIV